MMTEADRVMVLEKHGEEESSMVVNVVMDTGLAADDTRTVNNDPKQFLQGESNMKIAVASTDMKTLSRHFGRSAYFIVFHIENNTITRREIRKNNHAAHAKGGHGNERPHHHSSHGHTEIVNVLSDCEAVLCRGMGRRAREDIKAYGIKPCVIRSEVSFEEAVTAYLAGSLETAVESCEDRK